MKAEKCESENSKEPASREEAGSLYFRMQGLHRTIYGRSGRRSLLNDSHCGRDRELV